MIEDENEINGNETNIEENVEKLDLNFFIIITELKKMKDKYWKSFCTKLHVWKKF